MNVQQNAWGVVTDLLREARRELSSLTTVMGTDSPAVIDPNRAAQFEMFINANELELAWDVLADIADQVSSANFWEKLLICAGLMSLTTQAHLAATRLCESRSRETRMAL